MSAIEYQEPVYKDEDEVERLGKIVADLQDELAATKRELKIIGGELTTALHNWEAQKGKLRRQKMSLDERERRLDARDAMTAEEIGDAYSAKWRRKYEEEHELCEAFRATLGDVCVLSDKIRDKVMS